VKASRNLSALVLPPGNCAMPAVTNLLWYRNW